MNDQRPKLSAKHFGVGQPKVLEVQDTRGNDPFVASGTSEYGPWHMWSVGDRQPDGSTTDCSFFPSAYLHDTMMHNHMLEPIKPGDVLRITKVEAGDKAGWLIERRHDGEMLVSDSRKGDTVQSAPPTPQPEGATMPSTTNRWNLQSLLMLYGKCSTAIDEAYGKDSDESRAARTATLFIAAKDATSPNDLMPIAKEADGSRPPVTDDDIPF